MDKINPIIAVFRARGKEPIILEVRARIALLRARGYPRCGQCAGDFYAGLSPERIIFWVSLPLGMCTPVDQFMLERYPPRWQNRQALVKTLFQLFFKPPDNAVVNARAFYKLALLFGNPDTSGRPAQSAAGVAIAVHP